MNNQTSIAEQLKVMRKQHGLTQAELADRCRLDIRTIQRIEAGKVIPRSYTIRIINEVFGNNILVDLDDSAIQKELSNYRIVFRKRKTVRLIFAASAMLLLLTALILLLFTDFPKRIWAPYLYVFMFIILIGIGLTWRCPSCNAILGDVFNTRYCSKCGLHFYES